MNEYLTEGQRATLERARVGIAGAGGLGSNCACHLVRAGVKRFTVCDFDSVSASNLNRQFYFADQVGMKKTDALAVNLKRIEPTLELRMVDLRLDESNIAETFADCDVIVEAFDRADAKTMFLRALAGKGKFLVIASGLAGWGRSSSMGLRMIGKNIVAVGDGKSDVAKGLTPQSPRVGIAAAMQANSVVAHILGEEI